jgi:hypothetical protein
MIKLFSDGGRPGVAIEKKLNHSRDDVPKEFNRSNDKQVFAVFSGHCGFPGDFRTGSNQQRSYSRRFTCDWRFLTGKPSGYGSNNWYKAGYHQHRAGYFRQQ